MKKKHVIKFKGWKPQIVEVYVVPSPVIEGAEEVLTEAQARSLVGVTEQYPGGSIRVGLWSRMEASKRLVTYLEEGA